MSQSVGGPSSGALTGPTTLDRGASQPLVDRPLDPHPEDPARERELLDRAVAHRGEPHEPVVAEPVRDADGERRGCGVLEQRPHAVLVDPRLAVVELVRPGDEIRDPRRVGRTLRDGHPDVAGAEELDVVPERGGLERLRLEQAVLGQPAVVGVGLAGGDHGVDPGVEVRVRGVDDLEPRREERGLLAVEMVVVREQDVRGA